MEPKKKRSKRVVVAVWKNRSEREIEVFSNLKVFCESYPNFSYSTLNNYLGKAKTAFENDQLVLFRKEVYTKPIARKVRSIQAVVNRYNQATHEEAEQNLDFWLAAEPESRIYAVTKLASEGIPNDTKIDKQKIQKLKMKE
jgi:hypothetical protein